MLRTASARPSPLSVNAEGERADCGRHENDGCFEPQERDAQQARAHATPERGLPRTGVCCRSIDAVSATGAEPFAARRRVMNVAPIRLRSEEMAALPAVSAAAPPTTRADFQERAAAPPPLRTVSSESLPASRTRSTSPFGRRSLMISLRPWRAAGAAFVMASTSSSFVISVRRSMPIAPRKRDQFRLLVGIEARPPPPARAFDAASFAVAAARSRRSSAASMRSSAWLALLPGFRFEPLRLQARLLGCGTGRFRRVVGQAPRFGQRLESPPARAPRLAAGRPRHHSPLRRSRLPPRPQPPPAASSASASASARSRLTSSSAAF